MHVNFTGTIKDITQDHKHGVEQHFNKVTIHSFGYAI